MSGSSLSTVTHNVTGYKQTGGAMEDAAPVRKCCAELTPNGEVEGPHRSAQSEPRVHTVFPHPRRDYRSSRTPPTIVRRQWRCRRHAHFIASKVTALVIFSFPRITTTVTFSPSSCTYLSLSRSTGVSILWCPYSINTSPGLRPALSAGPCLD